MRSALPGYCGVACAACTDLLEQKCPGCRQTQWPKGDECPPVACCRKKGISCCGECEVFPCGMMEDFYKESPSHTEAYKRMKQLR